METQQSLQFTIYLASAGLEVILESTIIYTLLKGVILDCECLRYRGLYISLWRSIFFDKSCEYIISKQNRLDVSLR